MVLSAARYLDCQLSFKGRVAMSLLYRSVLDYMLTVKDFIEKLLYWWERRHDQDVLFLFFDDLKEDHIGCVRRIAKFIGVDCSEEVIGRVVHTTTHAEMARHHSKFDVSQIAKKFASLIGDDPPSEFVGRVRRKGGRSGDGEKVLPAEVKEEIERDWEQLVTTKLGFKDLREMRLAWQKECMNNSVI